MIKQCCCCSGLIHVHGYYDPSDQLAHGRHHCPQRLATRKSDQLCGRLESYAHTFFHVPTIQNDHFMGMPSSS